MDTGFNAVSGARRGRRLLRSPVEGLRALGVEPETVRTLIVTHLHYDHIGNADLFPNATLHVQDKEAAFATGRHMRHAFFRNMYEVDDVVGFVCEVYAGRVVFHDGDAGIAPGISVYLASGHTPGVQFVRVATRQGWLVLASDACHYTFLRQLEEVYEHERRRDPAYHLERIGQGGANLQPAALDSRRWLCARARPRPWLSDPSFPARTRPGTAVSRCRAEPVPRRSLRCLATARAAIACTNAARPWRRSTPATRAGERRPTRT